MTDNRARLKSAELLSIAGAAVLGAGVALVFQRWLAPSALVIVLVGLVAHAAGMFEKHRIEVGTRLRVALWETWLYWLCWLSLAALGGYLLFSTLQSTQ